MIGEDVSTSPFIDVSTSNPNYEAIIKVYENGWMAGVGGDKFDPEGTLTRGMAARILWNMVGQPAPAGVAPFLDVTSDAWYAEPIAWAYENGIMLGYDDASTVFGPNDYLTVEQFEIMLAKLNSETVPVYTGLSPYATRGWVASKIS